MTSAQSRIFRYAVEQLTESMPVACSRSAHRAQSSNKGQQNKDLLHHHQDEPTDDFMAEAVNAERDVLCRGGTDSYWWSSARTLAGMSTASPAIATRRRQTPLKSVLALPTALNSQTADWNIVKSSQLA